MRLENDGHSAFDAVDAPPPRIDVGAVKAPTIVITRAVVRNGFHGRSKQGGDRPPSAPALATESGASPPATRHSGNARRAN